MDIRAFSCVCTFGELDMLMQYATWNICFFNLIIWILIVGNVWIQLNMFGRNSKIMDTEWEM